MFAQAIQASAAVREALRQGASPLIPALRVCPACARLAMIATPASAVCTACDTAMVEVSREDAERLGAPVQPAAA